MKAILSDNSREHWQINIWQEYEKYLKDPARKPPTFRGNREQTVSNVHQHDNESIADLHAKLT